MNEQNAMISIDFWDTLVDGRVGGEKRREVRHKALRKISKEYGKTISAEEVEAASHRATEEFNRIWFSQQRTPNAAELVSKILNNLGIPAGKMEYDYLVQKFEDSLLDGPPALLDRAKPTIQSLSNRYRLTLISDTMYSPGRVLRKYLQEADLLGYFNGFLFSDEAGFSKPNPRAFRKMLEQTGCSPETSYHIGDRLNTDIAGAKAVGMKAILFTGISMKDSGNEEKSTGIPDHRCESWQEVHDLLL